MQALANSSTKIMMSRLLVTRHKISTFMPEFEVFMITHISSTPRLVVPLGID